MISGPAGRKKSQRNARAPHAANSKGARIDRREAMTRRGAIIRPEAALAGSEGSLD